MNWNDSPHGLNAELVRSQNQAAILQQLFASGPMTRGDLAESVGLTGASVSRIVRACIEIGLIEETGVVSEMRVGRRATLLALSSTRYGVASVHVGFIWLDIGIVNLQLVLLESLRISRNPRLSVEETVDQISEIIRMLAAKRGNLNILAIGVTLRTAVTPKADKISSRNLMQWPEMNLADAVQTATGLPTIVEDDLVAMAMAEVMHRNMELGEPLVLVSVGVAIGAGVVLNGEVLRGADGMAGFLETLEISNTANSPLFGKDLTDLAVIERCRQLGYEVTTILDVVGIAKRDGRVHELLQQRAQGVAQMLRVLAPVFNPRQFVMVGSAFFGDGYKEISEAYSEAVKHDSHAVPIVLGSFGEQEDVIGGAYVALRQVISPHLTLGAEPTGRVARYAPS